MLYYLNPLPFSLPHSSTINTQTSTSKLLAPHIYSYLHTGYRAGSCTHSCTPA